MTAFDYNKQQWIDGQAGSDLRIVQLTEELAFLAKLPKGTPGIKADIRACRRELIAAHSA